MPPALGLARIAASSVAASAFRESRATGGYGRATPSPGKTPGGPTETHGPYEMLYLRVEEPTERAAPLELGKNLV